MTINFFELENDATRFSEIKKYKEQKSELKDIAIRIIDQITSPGFAFPVQDQSVVSNGVTSYVYTDNMTYPNLLEFIAEVLHTKIPVIIDTATFGPGEIIINKDEEQEALDELKSCTHQLQMLVHGKEAKYL